LRFAFQDEMTSPAASLPALTCDLLVVGGGINGAGIARDAAGRGLSVILCEKDDLAQHTSSASSKLIHGGLRYLEYFEFGLVRKALQERELLLRMAPHIIRPMRFVMPHDAAQRPAWMIRLGLFLYDHLARRRFLPGSGVIALSRHAAGTPLKSAFTKGFIYSDGWVDDARLVVLNAMSAREKGARILTRTRCIRAAPAAGGWQAELDGARQGRCRVQARALVNACGPWAASFARDLPGAGASHELRLVKGSHIITRRLFDHDMAYLFQSPDKRVVFAIPYEQDYTLIGTTELDYHGDPGEAAIEEEEIAYLCAVVNRYFSRQIARADIVHSYSGVRPLLDQPAASTSAVTRDYLLETRREPAPLQHVWGGKITTYRKLAEEAVEQLLPLLNRAAPAWTAEQALPGGDLEAPGRLVARYDFDKYLRQLQTYHPWLPERLARRYAHSYGTRTSLLLGSAGSLAALGEQIAPDLYEAELAYLIEHEWALGADDVLWRRTKQGLRCRPADIERVADWMMAQADRR
jgi:glycerol-3-phosphate dehydrogenase